jgi:hypothetical protein
MIQRRIRAVVSPKTDRDQREPSDQVDKPMVNDRP